MNSISSYQPFIFTRSLLNLQGCTSNSDWVEIAEKTSLVCLHILLFVPAMVLDLTLISVQLIHRNINPPIPAQAHTTPSNPSIPPLPNLRSLFDPSLNDMFTRGIELGLQNNDVAQKVMYQELLEEHGTFRDLSKDTPLDIFRWSAACLLSYYLIYQIQYPRAELKIEELISPDQKRQLLSHFQKLSTDQRALAIYHLQVPNKQLVMEPRTRSFTEALNICAGNMPINKKFIEIYLRAYPVNN